MSEKRKKLPSRRLSEVRKIKLENDQSLYVTLGYDPKFPSVPKEVFYDRGFREGAELQFIANDMCIMISLLLQAQYSAKDIAKSLSKTTLDTPAGEVSKHGSMVGMIVEQLQIAPLWSEEVSGSTTKGLDQ